MKREKGALALVIKVVPVIIGALGGGMKMLKTELKRVFNDQELVDKIAGEMQRTVLMNSESIIRRVISGLIQGDEVRGKNVSGDLALKR